MLRTICLFTVTALVLSVVAATAVAAELKTGTPELKSAGPICFGPEGILFVADSQSATITAIDTGERGGSASADSLNVDGINEKIAALLGTSAEGILITDLAVHPASKQVYLSVMRGRGPKGSPVLVRVDAAGTIHDVSLQNVKYDQASLPNPPADSGTGRHNRRGESITDLAYVDGRLLIAGLSNEEFASKLRSLPYPFEDAEAGTSVEIFHGAHGRFETASPVRTFVPYEIAGEPHLLAAYTCTPLVKFPLSQLRTGAKVKGTTVAELGNRNRPLDMIVYQQDDKDYLLIANNRRGIMKVTTEGLEIDEGITEKIAGTAGVEYDTVDELKGIVQLDRFDDERALVLVQKEDGAIDLQTIALP